MKHFAIVVAAGSSARMGGNIPKQYQKISGKPMVSWSIDVFLSNKNISGVVLVVNQKDAIFYQDIQRIQDVHIVLGGNLRQDSVRNAVEYLSRYNHSTQDMATDIGVLIHDAARPFVSQCLIDKVITSLNNGAEAVDIGIDIVDTIKYYSSVSNEKIDRNQLYATQTPQGFRLESICRLHQKYQNTDIPFTDDISMALSDGIDVDVVIGEKTNWKITCGDDMIISQIYAKFLLEGKI